MATPRAASTQYGPAAKEAVASALHREKKGTLKSGAGRHPKVKSREQAIAIGLSEARKKGAKVPPLAGASKRSAAQKSARKSPAAKSTATKPASADRSNRKRGAAKRSAA